MTPGRSAILVLTLVLAACSSTSGTTPTDRGTQLTVFAAASLGPALERARTVYEAANPGTTLTVSTDSSAALATQIEQGAPADVFLSADTTNAQRLVDGGNASGEVVAFATNRLAVVVPSGNPARITTPADLAREGVTVIAAGDAVPITRYAARLVANLAGEPGYPRDFAAAYARNVASKEDSVAAVVAKIELGEGDAAIVYATDARRSTRVRVIAVPAGANVSTSYGGVVVRTSAEPERASAFLAWLAGPDGQAVLRDFGFGPPP